MDLDLFIAGAARMIEVGAVAILLVGLVASGTIFMRDCVRPGPGAAYHNLRANLGRSILLGLEVLIVADIIRSVALEPTLRNLGLLGLIILIRTFLSFALEVEIRGQLPWRRGIEAVPHQPPSER
jgi:uncharacterized membrane protein